MGKSHPLLIGDGMRSASSALRIVLSTTIFKMNIDNIATIIVFICNKSMSSRILPERLAVTIVACVYKAGNISSL